MARRKHQEEEEGGGEEDCADDVIDEEEQNPPAADGGAANSPPEGYRLQGTDCFFDGPQRQQQGQQRQPKEPAKTCWMALLLALELLRSAATEVRLLPTELGRRLLRQRGKPILSRSTHIVHLGSSYHGSTGDAGESAQAIKSVVDVARNFLRCRFWTPGSFVGPRVYTAHAKGARSLWRAPAQSSGQRFQPSLCPIGRLLICLLDCTCTSQVATHKTKREQLYITPPFMACACFETFEGLVRNHGFRLASLR